MRVGIDCRLSGKKNGGIGRYIQHLVTQMIVESTDSIWVLFFHDQDQVNECFKTKIPKNVEIKLTPIRHYTIKEQVLFPLTLYRAKLDMLHVPHFNVPILFTGKLVVTIHDLLWHEHRGTSVTTLPKSIYWFKYFFYRCITNIAIHKAHKILVPSETIKKTVVHYVPSAEEKIMVTPEGAELQNNTDEKVRDEIKKIIETKQPYIIYVGSLYPHKNVTVVIEALTQLPELYLVIAGSRSIFQDDTENTIATRKVKKQVHFTGYVSDTELSYLYKHSKALIQPSLSEGFGLTGIEALAQGTAVIASDIPIFKEIYKNNVVYFDPHSASSLVTALQHLNKTDKQTQQKIAEHILKEYQWEKTAQLTLAAYDEVLSK